MGSRKEKLECCDVLTGMVENVNKMAVNKAMNLNGSPRFRILTLTMGFGKG